MSYELSLFSYTLFPDPSSNPVYEESKTLFHGEDFHILLPSREVEVTFKNISDPRKPVVLMKGGKVVNSRAKPNLHLNHLIIEGVGEGDEGEYTVKNPENPDDVRRIMLIVRGTR